MTAIDPRQTLKDTMDDDSIVRILSAPRRFAEGYPFRTFFALFALQFSIPLAIELFSKNELEVDLAASAVIIWVSSLLWLAVFRFLWPTKDWFRKLL